MEPSILSGDSTLELEPVTCSACGHDFAPGAAVFERGHWRCRDCARLAAEIVHGAAPVVRSTSASRLVPALLAGALGALAGATVFAAVGIATDFEIGYIAVLVGFLTGLGVRLGGREQAEHLAVPAAGLAIAGVAAAKYLVFAYVATSDLPISMFSGRVFGVFAEHLGDLLSPFDVLWVVLAAGAAMRAARGQRR